MATKWLPIILAGVLFGVLMAFRSELHSMWSRALVAGGAFAMLGGAIALVRAKQV